MEKYNYKEAMYSDIMDYIKWNNCELDYRKLYDDLWIDDSVTGNASGSYTCNALQAEEYLCHNMNLLQEALEEFGYGGTCNTNIFDNGAEWCDVTIRCYLLGEVLREVINDLEEEIEEVEP